MKNKLIIASLIFLFSNITYASLYPEAAPCNPSVLGTYCEIHPKILPTKKFKNYAICGRTYVAITARQRAVLNSYLRENKNMIIRFKIDNEYVDAPCF